MIGSLDPIHIEWPTQTLGPSILNGVLSLERFWLQFFDPSGTLYSEYNDNANTD